jgi:hypothetical protein
LIKKVVVNLPLKGTYEFICSILEDGVTKKSKSFSVAIQSDDLSFLEKGLWKALTGGQNKTKTWILDVKKGFFHNPLDFYGDTEAGAPDGKPWGPWGGTSLYDWGGEPEVGEITFNGITKGVKFTLDNTVVEGTYSLNVFNRDPNFLTLQDGKSLWVNMLTGKYKYLGVLSAEMGDLKLSGNNLRFPMDKGRIAEAQFLPEDMQNLKIIHASDSALVIRVKRTYEGKDADKKESKCWLLYNYIVKEYKYEPEVFTYSESVKTSFTAADLVGTWKYAAVPQGWVAFAKTGNKGTFYPAHLFATWKTRDEIVATLVGWGATDAAATFAAADANEYVFKNDGTCTLNGVANTYNVSNGVISFGNDLTNEFSLVWITLGGKEVKVIDFNKAGDEGAFIDYPTEGIWIGQKDPAKDEYKAVHLVKKTK